MALSPTTWCREPRPWTRYRSSNCNSVGTLQGRYSKAVNKQSIADVDTYAATHGGHGLWGWKVFREPKINHLDAGWISPLQQHEVLRLYISTSIIRKGASAYLCEMLFSWRYMSALRSCFMIMAASFSVKCLRSRIKWKSSPPLQYSNTKKQTSFHSQISCSFIMWGWFYADRHSEGWLSV